MMTPLKSVSYGLRVLSFIFGTLSIVVIVVRAFDIGLEPIMQLILDHYDQLIRLLFSWLEPHLVNLLEWFSNLVGLNVQLYPQWQHILVLLCLYFGAHTRAAWSVGHKSAAAFDVVWGGLVAFGAIVFSGLVPTYGILSYMLMPLSVVLGVVTFGVGTSVRAATLFRDKGEPWWSAFREFVRHSMRFAFGGGIIIGIGVVLGSQFTNLHPQALAILTLLVLVVSLAFYRIIVGPRWGRYEPDKSGTMWQRTRRSVEAQIGFSMLFTICVAALYVLSGAGLK